MMAMLSVVECFYSDMAAEANATCQMGPFKFPHGIIGKPVIGLFDLPAIVDKLAEHAIAVAQPVTTDRQGKAGGAVEKASSQTAESAIAESCILFKLFDIFQCNTEFTQGIMDCIGHFKIVQGIAESSAHQVFQ